MLVTPTQKEILKIDVTFFLNGKSFRYKIIFQFCTQLTYLIIQLWMVGFLYELREEITWNITANLTALPGGNLFLDLVNVLQNNEFKSKFRKTILLFFLIIPYLNAIRWHYNIILSRWKAGRWTVEMSGFQGCKLQSLNYKSGIHFEFWK